MDATSERVEGNGRSRVVVLIGGVGSGKKTIANRIAGIRIFHCEGAVSSTTRAPGYFCETFEREGIRYRILTIDTEILRSADLSKILKFLKIETVNLILFAIPNGRYTDESHAPMMRAIEKLPQRATHISALVFTHCESMSTQIREDIVGKFRVHKRCSQVAAFMGKGIQTVGFPETFLNPTLKEAMKGEMEDDERSLRNLVEGSKDEISIITLLREFPNQQSSLQPTTRGQTFLRRVNDFCAIL